MSDKQLAVLLFSLVREINGFTAEVEQSLARRGATLEEATDDRAVVLLRGLADGLYARVKSLEASP
jgi:hypothetical protein